MNQYEAFSLALIIVAGICVPITIWHAKEAYVAARMLNAGYVWDEQKREWVKS